MSLVKEAHSMIPDYPYMVWGFALSENGWVIAEGNWGFFISQYSREGARKEFMECFR